jgi:hypothetical protein
MAVAAIPLDDRNCCGFHSGSASVGLTQMAAGALGGCSVAIMAVTTRFTELVGCRVPIQQAPMGSV